MDLETLSQHESTIKDLIKREYVDPSKQSWPIYDGVVDPVEYLKTSPRILWILKEPYDGGESRTGGDWSLTQDLLNKQMDRMSRKPAFQPICYISYGVWKNQTWDQMPWLRDSVDVRNCLRRIAFINVSKLPGLKSSPWSRISEAYNRYRAVILHQISVYHPNIIFACDPHANLIRKDLAAQDTEWTHNGTAASIGLTDEQRLVWVGHPEGRLEHLPGRCRIFRQRRATSTN